MADDSAMKKQALLSGFTDQSTGTSKKRRIRRCKTMPASDANFLDFEKVNGLFPVSNFIMKNFRPSFRKAFVFLIIYLFVGCTCFYLVRDQIIGKKTNGILDALYFCIVTMTTVGYGDLVPHSVAAKLLACAFVFSGMAFVALFLGKAADYLVEKQEVLLVKAVHLKRKVGMQQMLKEIDTRKAEYKFLTIAVVLLVLISLGVIILVKVEKLDIIDAFYCVCATITTLGYGDKSFSTALGRVFSVFWILTSTICLAQFFLYIAEIQMEHRRQSLVKWVLTRRMTIVDLEAADLDDDGVVSAAEFVIYKLKEMGKIDQEDVALVLEEFENLDIDQTGTISNSDLLLAQSIE
ncbi:two-pore potassium channel 1 [Phalaenopsis equestris]|uniref:two-pore potassium channel 1 n=1 Tax=Phalaenopsis equestris TaxID=78828 RepID=UPI0009E46D68|nr:two-pore potassium channel 1 [Phalaenopsis equestris]XP_020591788.1 two-pore potassium channel 1 [Phalaenopsis equestris]